VKLSAVLVECVVNISEGRDTALLSRLDAAAGSSLVDRHSDPDHHRSVFTLAGPADQVAPAARALAAATVAALDLRRHDGAHPRLGVLDVVPFVPYAPGQLPPADLGLAETLRDQFATWLADELGVPAFCYGPRPDGTVRSLPEVRREAFTTLVPDAGPATPHPSAGATAVGARRVLVAYNVWVSDVAISRAVARLVRGPAVRALGLAVGTRAQVSCNLIEPALVGPDLLYDQVVTAVTQAGGTVLGTELVGLLPAAVLERIPPERWASLDLSADRTVEARL
jgi:glutamate formiminotransferase